MKSHFKQENDPEYFASLINIDHPNLIQIVEYFETILSYYIIMEYFDGTSLDKIIRSK